MVIPMVAAVSNQLLPYKSVDAELGLSACPYSPLISALFGPGIAAPIPRSAGHCLRYPLVGPGWTLAFALVSIPTDNAEILPSMLPYSWGVCKLGSFL